MRDKTKYHISFKKGEAATELISEPYKFRRTGTIQRWKPDSEVFTETVIPLETFQEIIKRQSVINSGIEFVLKDSERVRVQLQLSEGIRAYVDEPRI